MRPKRPLLYRIGKRSRFLLDRLIARSSLIGTGPIIDPSELPWTAELSGQWRTIRAEAERLMPGLGEIPPLGVMSPSHGGIAGGDHWRAFFLYGYGYKVEKNCARCPETAKIVEQIPDLNTAFFSILSPGTRIDPHTGPTKGLVTCHLGILVPPDGSCRMRHRRPRGRLGRGRMPGLRRHLPARGHPRWGQRRASSCSSRSGDRSKFPGRQIADLFLAGIRRSHFVQEARTNMDKWEQALSAADRPSL